MVTGRIPVGGDLGRPLLRWRAIRVGRADQGRPLRGVSRLLEGWWKGKEGVAEKGGALYNASY